MARYRVEAISWIAGKTVMPGEEIEYDGVPGSKLTPLDDEARAAVAKRGGAKGSVLNQPRTLEPIPDDWEDFGAQRVIALARKLGAPPSGTSREVATKFIKEEIARRATV